MKSEVPLNMQVFGKEIEHALFAQKCKNFFKLRNSSRDKIAVTPVVQFFEGTLKNPLRHIATTKGHLVDNALIGLCDYTSSGGFGSMSCPMYNFGVGGSGVPAIPSIRLGTGTGSTTGSTAALVSIINTPPSSIAGSTSNPSAAHYLNAMTATWNAGTIAALTVTEAGLWMYLLNTLNVFGSTSASTSCLFADRVSSTDGDFSSFTINTSNPLSVQYQLNWNYI
jgi:hypothetical protein